MHAASSPHEFIIKPFIYVKLHNQNYLLFIGWHNQSTKSSDGMEYGLYMVLQHETSGKVM